MITKSQANQLVPLYFDGSVNYFSVLPLPSETEKLQRIYATIKENKEKEKEKKHTLLFAFLTKFNNLIKN